MNPVSCCKSTVEEPENLCSFRGEMATSKGLRFTQACNALPVMSFVPGILSPSGYH